MGEDHKLDREKEYSMDQEIKMGEKEKQAMLEDIRAKLEEFAKDRGQLVPILQMVQELHAYLDPTAIKLVADHLEIPTCEVYGVATFYNQFRFHPPGKHHIKVCLGTGCFVNGGKTILNHLERKLAVKSGETTRDTRFSLEIVRCLGCCALAPVLGVNDDVYHVDDLDKLPGILDGYE